MKSVLLIEDDPLTQKLVEGLLQPHADRLQVRCVDNGEAALEAAARLPADLVVCDLYLPKKDGLVLAEELSRIAPARFFFMGAGHVDPALRERAQTKLRAPIFGKPLELPELVSALLAAVENEEPAIASSDTVLPEIGSLAERPVPHLLLDLWERRRTGLLELARGRVHKQVVIRKGAPVAVASNLRSETLGHLLVQRGKITDAQHQQAIGQAQRENERLGRVLVRQGLMQEHELLDELAAQMRHKLVQSLRWPDGTFRFVPGEPEGDRLELPFETPRLVLSGLRRTARIDEIVPRLRTASARVSLNRRAERHRATLARTFPDTLAIFDGRPLTSELVAHGDAAKLLVTADVLLRADCAQLEPLGEQANATPVRDPLALVELGKDRRTHAPAPRSTEEGLFADPETGPHELPEPAPMPAEDSGVFPIPGGPTSLSSEELRELDPNGEALRKEVLAEYLALHAKDYYQLLGVARHAASQDIALAHAAIARRFRFERFAQVELGRDYARLEEIAARIKLAYETLINPARRQAYDRSLQPVESGKGDHRLDAEVLSHQGQAKLTRGEYAAARHKLEQAVAADPEQPDYHALLGWATYLTALGPGRESISLERTRAAADQARPHLETALSIDPDHVDAHDFLGRVDAAIGDDASAADHLEVVLDQAPTRAEVLTLIEAALGRRGDWTRLEQLYRRLIHRLADDTTERPLLVWWRLAELYRTRLLDHGAAQVAYETVARLAPDDPRPRRAIASLLHREAGSTEELAIALREAWRLEPEDPTPGLDLFHAHVESERWDAALVVSMALACRGASDADAAQFLRSHRPRFLVRAQEPIGNSLFDSLRHPGDVVALGAVFAEVFAVSAPEISFAHLGVTHGEAVPSQELPEPFARALLYVAHELAVAPPEVYVRQDFGAEIHLGAARPPVLLVGPQALALTDVLVLTFRLGRALSYARSGRALTAALPTRELKEHLGAALTLAQPGMRFDDPEGRIAQLRTRLSGRAVSLAHALRPLVDKLLSDTPERINLSRFVAAMARTADRIGLVLCNDLVTAARIVGEECAPGAEDELLDFALSDVYLDARRRLGLAVAV